MSKLLTIGEAAKASGLSAKMIRHYEQSGLLEKTPRTEAGYRLYNTQQLRQLNFIRRGRQLGFSLEEIHSLLNLWRDPGRESREVKQIAEKHLEDVAQKIVELQQIHGVLEKLAKQCCGNSNPDCAILDSLAAMEV